MELRKIFAEGRGTIRLHIVYVYLLLICRPQLLFDVNGKMQYLISGVQERSDNAASFTFIQPIRSIFRSSFFAPILTFF